MWEGGRWKLLDSFRERHFELSRMETSVNHGSLKAFLLLGHEKGHKRVVVAVTEMSRKGEGKEMDFCEGKKRNFPWNYKKESWHKTRICIKSVQNPESIHPSDHFDPLSPFHRRMKGSWWSTGSVNHLIYLKVLIFHYQPSHSSFPSSFLPSPSYFTQWKNDVKREEKEVSLWIYLTLIRVTNKSCNIQMQM